MIAAPEAPIEEHHVYGAVAELFAPFEEDAWEEGELWVRLKEGRRPSREYLVEGPAGCIAGDQEIQDLATGERVAVGELVWRKQGPVVMTMNGPVRASAPHMKGVAPMATVLLSDGRSFRAIGSHRVLTWRGWTSVDSLVPGTVLPSSSPEDARRWRRTARGSRADRPRACHSGGGQPRRGRGSDLVSPPSRDGDGAPDCGGYGSDVQESTPAHTPACRRFAPRSRQGCSSHECCGTSGTRLGADDAVAVRCGACARTQKPAACQCQSRQQSPVASLRRARVGRLDRAVARTGLGAPDRREPSSGGSSRHPAYSRSARPLRGCSHALDTGEGSLGYALKDGLSSCRYYKARQVRVESIRWGDPEPYYDLTVPGEGHYLLGGTWHHNTGKSHGVLDAIYQCCVLWPGIRVLFLRQTKATLAESILVEWEEEILGAGHPAISGTADRKNRSHYTFPPGLNPYTGKVGRTRVVCAGLDDPQKLFSTQWDIIATFEAIETMLGSWLKSVRGNRNNKMPWQWRIAETNPGPESHYLNRRPDEPESLMVRLMSVHKDNPAYYDHELDDWTPFGRDFVLGDLANLPEGATRDRMYLGKWVSEAGLVWPQFRRDIHCISADLVPADADWYVGSMDFGFSHAGVVNIWAIDGLRRAFRVAEVYRSAWTIEEWADAVCKLDQLFPLQALICDSARPDDIKSLNVRLAKHRGHPIKGIAQKCYKRPDSGGGSRQLFGLDHVREMLSPDPNWPGWAEDEPAGLAPGVSLFFVNDSQVFGVDTELARSYRPTSTVQEIESYYFPKDEDGNPTAENPEKKKAGGDDGCDSVRYLATWLDRRQKAKPKPKTWEPGTLGHKWEQQERRALEQERRRRRA